MVLIQLKILKNTVDKWAKELKAFISKFNIFIFFYILKKLFLKKINININELQIGKKKNYESNESIVPYSRTKEYDIFSLLIIEFSNNFSLQN